MSRPRASSRGLLRGLLRPAAAGVVLALPLAGAAAARAAERGAWWSDGLRWLTLDAGVWWFDRLAPACAGVLVVLALAWRWWRGRARRPPRAAARGRGAAVAALLRAAAAIVPPVPDGPNVVLVSIDTLRADGLGAYGNPRPTSPTFDARLAAEGVLFSDVLSQAPKTTPSHMTMLTGVYPAVHGVTMWEGATAEPVLNPRLHTLAELLRNAGWRTVAFTDGGPMHASRGFEHGFEVYRHTKPLARAQRWIAGNAGGRRPVFLFFHSFEIHDPYTPPPGWIDQFDPDYRGPILDAVRAIRRGAENWEQAHALFWKDVDPTDPRAVAFVHRLYEAGIRHMDDLTLARLLADLAARDPRRETLVVFTSDHGEAFAEHGAFLHDDLWRHTLHVPLVLRWPGRLPAGLRIDAPVRLLDLTPTILDLVGVPAPAYVQGRSLVPLLRGAPLPPQPVVSEHGPPHRTPRFQSLRLDGHTLLLLGDHMQLFDLAADPGERVDRAAADPALVARLRAELDRWQAECARLAARLGPEGAGVAPPPDVMRQLRALGYVE
ncbi:MAG: sulfatase [bacterium]|nr:sulfatase [bacterium]